MNLADELEKLNNLKQNGVISEAEYQQAKDALLAKIRPAETVTVLDSNTWGGLHPCLAVSDLSGTASRHHRPDYPVAAQKG